MTFTYDSGGNELTSATSGPGTGQPSVTLTSTYNPQNNLASVTDNVSGNVGITTYLYDAGQRLTTITTSYNGTSGPEIVTAYAPNNQISAQLRTIGGSGTAVNTSYGYDAADRQTTITDYVSGGSALATYVYSYDNANRVTTLVDAEGTYTYTYDNGNELTSVYKGGAQVESYAYDANGSRTGTGYSTTVMNETLTSPGVVTYTYDSAGNMTSADSGGTYTTYTYDYRNRLTEVKQGGTLIATYTYNALDQRIGIQDSGGSTTWTIYNGTSANSFPYADFNGSGGALLTRYVSGPGMVNGAVVDELLARTSSGGTTAWYLTDKLDSVRDVVSSAGSVLDHVVYDSFGNITTETNASNGDRFKFAGMEYDSTTGRYYDRARAYDEELGRFTSLDPALFTSSTTNLFNYVGNDPPDERDVSGNAPDVIGPASVLLSGAGVTVGTTVGPALALGGSVVAAPSSTASASQQPAPEQLPDLPVDLFGPEGNSLLNLTPPNLLADPEMVVPADPQMDDLMVIPGEPNKVTEQLILDLIDAITTVNGEMTEDLNWLVQKSKETTNPKLLARLAAEIKDVQDKKDSARTIIEILEDLDKVIQEYGVPPRPVVPPPI